MRRQRNVSLPLLLFISLLFRLFFFFPSSSSSFHLNLAVFFPPFSVFAYGGIPSRPFHSCSFTTKGTARRLSSAFSRLSRLWQSSRGQASCTIDIDSFSFPSSSSISSSSSFLSERKTKDGASSFINTARSQKGDDVSLGDLSREVFLHADPSMVLHERIDSEISRQTSRFAGRSASSSFSSTPARLSQTCFYPSLLIGRERRRSRKSVALLRANFIPPSHRFFHKGLPSVLYLPFPSALGKARLSIPSCGVWSRKRMRERDFLSLQKLSALMRKPDEYDRRSSWKPSGSFPLWSDGGELMKTITSTETRNSKAQRRWGVCTSLYMTMDGDWGGGGGGTMYYHPGRVFSPSPSVFLPTVEDTKGEGNHMDVLSWLFNRRRTILLQSSLTDDVASALIAQLLFLSQSPSPSTPNSSVATARRSEGLLPASWSNEETSLEKLRSRTQDHKGNQGEFLGEKKKDGEEKEGETPPHFDERRKKEEAQEGGGDVDEGRKRRRDEHEEHVPTNERKDAMEKLDSEGEEEEENEDSFVKERRLRESVLVLRSSRLKERKRESSARRLKKRSRQRRRRTGDMCDIHPSRQVSLPPVEILINSPGGSVTAALSVLNIMQSLPCEVITTCTGQAGGVAALLLAAGTPGLRRAFPASRISLQQVEVRMAKR
ncbi:atp-dependent clp protease proteolytic subunit [Cystoisospora suis]|uniref:ATP-dependent Clp protease proteolytic subunit n=1 Tax=Cystoisospora suis TaxID=483139 RepID=A0A2C6LED7_9APIC|nr:atp-dependent clp protease proteolytic subunit [Cystoisospora suis]